MTKRQAIKYGDQLRDALQVYFLNCVPEALRGIIKVRHVFEQGATGFVLAYDVVSPAGSVDFDSIAIIKEIERMIPDVRVTESGVWFSTRCIFFVCRELGKKGTHLVRFIDVKA